MMSAEKSDKCAFATPSVVLRIENIDEGIKDCIKLVTESHDVLQEVVQFTTGNMTTNKV